MNKVRPITWVALALTIGGLVMAVLRLPWGFEISAVGMVLSAMGLLTGE